MTILREDCISRVSLEELNLENEHVYIERGFVRMSYRIWSSKINNDCL